MMVHFYVHVIYNSWCVSLVQWRGMFYWCLLLFMFCALFMFCLSFASQIWNSEIVFYTKNFALSYSIDVVSALSYYVVLFNITCSIMIYIVEVTFWTYSCLDSVVCIAVATIYLWLFFTNVNPRLVKCHEFLCSCFAGPWSTRFVTVGFWLTIHPT